MQKAFTMIELILTIVIMGILASGAYISLSHLYTKSAKSKAVSELSFDSTLISNQISSLLSHRVPSTVIGYDANKSHFESIYTLDANYTILEWIGTDFENYNAKVYSGFVDFAKSDKDENLLFSPDTKISETEANALIFAGAFDEGGVVYGDDFNSSFGWHDHNHSMIFDINDSSTEENITLINRPEKIYEKYYLLQSGYALARYKDINKSASCITELNTTVGDKTINDNTLFLFYNFQPWKRKTFCADPNGGTTIDGNVTILSNEVSGFQIDFINENLKFNISLQREIQKAGKNLIIKVSKQKVVF